MHAFFVMILVVVCCYTLFLSHVLGQVCSEESCSADESHRVLLVSFSDEGHVSDGLLARTANHLNIKIKLLGGEGVNPGLPFDCSLFPKFLLFFLGRQKLEIKTSSFGSLLGT